MNGIGTAYAGMMAASTRFAASAQRVAGGEGDFVVEAVEQVSSKTAYRASLAVVRAQERMFERLLDIKV